MSGPKLSLEDMHPYQHRMVEHIREHPFNALWVDMGLGKTVSALTATQSLIADFDVDQTLVIAPLRVARKTWTDEIANWAHLQGLTTSKIIGTPKQRLAGANRKADIHLINRENIDWLVNLHVELRGDRWNLVHKWRWDNVILDESSSFKGPDSNRTIAVKMMRKYMQRMTQLTGTPAPNGLHDLWSQLQLLDHGQRLGAGVGDFRRRWFDPPSFEHSQYQMKEFAEAQIHDAVKDICLTMRAEDYLDLPPIMDNYIPVVLSRAEKAKYDAFERTYVLEMAGKKITAVNAGVLWGKLLQCANGAVYTEHPAWEDFHKKKLDALMEIESVVSGPMMVIYNYKHDLARIEKAYKKAKINYRILKTEQDEDDWNAGKIHRLLLHPGGAGHGLNIHENGCEEMMMFGQNSNLEFVQQVIARIAGGHRRIGKNVRVHWIITEDTVDESLMVRQGDKEAVQNRLLEATKVLVRKYA